MTITLDLPTATLDRLHAESLLSGKDVETLVVEAVVSKFAAPNKSFADVLKPLQDAVAASGLSPEEAEELFEKELKAHRTER